MDHRDASVWGRPLGGWLALGLVALLAAIEAIVHQRTDGATVPWWHLGASAGLVLWGGWRMLPWVVGGTATGLLAAVTVSVLANPVLDVADGAVWVAVAHLVVILALPLAEALGLAAMLLVMGGHREVIVSGRVDLPNAMRWVAAGMPAALLPSIGLLVGATVLMGATLHEVPLRIVSGAFAGLITVAPLMVSMLPSSTTPHAYRCHCRYPAVPMIAMALLVPIGLAPSLPGGEPIQSMTFMGLGAMGILGWLSLASGWMATSMGMLMLGLAVWASSLLGPSTGRLGPASELLLLSPAFVTGLLFASTMETRFRDRAKITDQRDELRTILDATGAAMLRTDRAGRVTYANAAAHDLRPAGDRPIGSALADWLGERAGARVLAALDQDRPELEIELPGRDHATRHQVLATPLRDEHDAVRGHTIVIVDLTPRLRREASRRRKLRREQASIANACLHEVNSMAMAVGGAASLARESCDDTTVGRLAIEIERSCDDAARRAERLRHLAPGKPAASRIDLGDLTRRRIEDAIGQARIARGDVRIDSDLTVRIDPAFATFVIDEFVQNAVDAARNGRPTISATAAIDPDRDDLAVLEMTDDGPGLSPEVRRQVGRTFVTSKGQGRGLGLAAIQTGVRQAGGQMRITSTDRGTTLRVVLPLATTIATAST